MFLLMPFVRNRTKTKIMITIPSRRFVRAIPRKRYKFNFCSLSLSDRVKRRQMVEKPIDRMIAIVVNFLMRASVDEKGFFRTEYKSRMIDVLKKSDM